jgi:hypothetical protein
MRDQEWNLIEPGDLLDYMPPASSAEPHPTSRRFQVFKLDKGVVFAVRILNNRDDGSADFTVSETVRIAKNSPRWKMVSLKSKLVATGGFLVTRADGSTEYDRCPTPLDRSQAAPQTLQSRG